MTQAERIYIEHYHALADLSHADRFIDIAEIEGNSQAVHDTAAGIVHVKHHAPRWLAHAARLAIIPDDRIPDATFALLDGRIIYHRPHHDRRRIGGAILHELAEHLLAGEQAPHSDVQLQMIALVFPPREGFAMMRRMGPRRMQSYLQKNLRDVPRLFIRLRVEMLKAQLFPTLI